MAHLNETIELLRQKMRVQHLAWRSEESYVGWVCRYAEFVKTLSRDLTHEQKFEAFLTHLAIKQNVAASTQNQAFNAIVYLYKHVLNQPLGEVHALRAKRPTRERTAPSKDEMRRLLAALVDTPNNPAKLLGQLLYGCGLRVQEPLELRIKDVLLSESQLIIRAAKGDKDRRVPIPCCLIEPLRKQIERARLSWQWDRAHRPGVGVTLFGAIDKKYPKAKYAWPWFWLFPAPGHCAHPRTGVIVHWRLHEASLQRAVKEAGQRAQLDTVVTPHNLRHAYATHSREDVQVIQKILGHANIETTMGYRHREINEAASPLDELAVS
jgi:integron integrase